MPSPKNNDPFEPAALAAAPIGSYDIEAIKSLADKAGSQVITIDNVAGEGTLPKTIPVLLNREDGVARGVKALFEEWRGAPERKKGTAKVNTLQSFSDLTNRHKTEDSVIFADTNWRNPSLTAIIDYHEIANGGVAAFGQHRIHYPFPLTDEWKAWIKINGEALDQTAFAEFIEDHRAELAAPHEDEITYWEETLGGKLAYPNELQMLSRGLKINADVKASSAVTLQTGEGEISWEETHQARNNQGQKIVVPSLFMLQIAPFEQGEKARVPVRLRYRMPPGGGAVKWIVMLYRPDIYITEEVIRNLERAANKTELPTFQGTPEMSA